MKKEAGLWIDHRKAVIVTIDDESEMTREIRSNMEKHVRFSNNASSKIPADARGSAAEDMRDRQFQTHLDNYYDGVVSLVRDVGSIWIFGPGAAKVELVNRLKRGNFEGQIVGIDTVDKMTDQQIAAKVRNRFLR
jgi:hypothetical protein